MKTLLILLLGLVLDLAARAQPTPIMVLPPWLLHASPAVKPATKQAADAKASRMAIVAPVSTNYLTLGFFAEPVDTNKVIWVQSTSALGKLPFTNVVGYVRNSASITNKFGCTAPGRLFRLYLP